MMIETVTELLVISNGGSYEGHQERVKTDDGRSSWIAGENLLDLHPFVLDSSRPLSIFRILVDIIIIVVHDL